jgi:tryptophan-rich sensory protein
MSYIRFGLMILTSTVVMFILMYLNTYAWEHVFFSETRTYMAIMMGATMAVIMLAYMLGMYSNKRLNIAIFAARSSCSDLSCGSSAARSPSRGRATCGR